MASRSVPRRRGRALAILTLVGVLLGACSGTVDDLGSLAVDSDALELGRAVYAANCATCHGERGEGQPNWQSRRPDGTLPAPPHDVSGHTWHHPDEVLIEIVTVGGQAAYGGSGIISGMPAFGEQLTAAEITAVLAHIRTLWGTAERSYQESLR
ncbi:MAG: cytochrome C [Chloroflexi bacterium HGW-Chloroflexi-9]|nr:MAG: cytochrome C [Chloroflexi bacterium HGW-Chloroflexi-9]